MSGLHQLLVEHGAALEADLAEHYGVALTDLATGALSWRRFAVLVHGLPLQSRTAKAVLGPSAEWSTTEHLLATLVDIEQAALWQRAGKKGAPKPRPVPRPGSDTGRRFGRARMTPEQLDQLLGQPQEAPDGD